MACALRPIGLIRRLACVGLSFFAVAVIYYSQMRMTFLMLLICMAVLVVIFTVQRNFGHAALLGGLSASLIAGALVWVMTTSGHVVVERFLGLASRNFSETYDQSGRGWFVTQTLQTTMWEYPLGMGLGRWGSIYGAFGDHTKQSIWVEVMVPAWVIDGGIPLLVLYNLAIVLAMFSTLRIALRSRDRDVGFWAAVVFASQLSILATSFSYVTFVAAIGMQFWLLGAIIHGADYRVRVAAAKRSRAVPPRPAPAPAPAASPPRPPGWPSP